MVQDGAEPSTLAHQADLLRSVEALQTGVRFPRRPAFLGICHGTAPERLRNLRRRQRPAFFEDLRFSW